MFLNNRSSHRPQLARGRVDESLALAAVVVERTLCVDGRIWAPCTTPRTASDPPNTAGEPLWEGTSVTVSGSVRGPRVPPFRAEVQVVAGAERRAVVVWGDRQWVRNAGRLIASQPAPFLEKPLSWTLAFGGGYDVAPGMCPIRRLPHPGGRVAHPLNPVGVGFYRDEAAAEGKPLPSIEWPDALVTRWDDRPEPAGLSPCPELRGLRLPSGLTAPKEDLDAEVEIALRCRLLHPACGRLVLTELRAGSPVLVRGVGIEMPVLEVPPSPVRVTAVRGASATPVPSGLRWIHIDAAAGIARLCYGHSFAYSPAAPPSSIAVRDT